MQNIAIDHNGFLTVGECNETGKEYTRNFLWYPYSAYDHTVLILRKENGKITIEQRQWKDLGPSQQVLRMRKQQPVVDQVWPEQQAAIVAGFHILHTQSDQGVYQRMGKVDATVKSYVEANTWLGEGRMDMKDLEAIVADNLTFVLFGILLAHGSWIVKELNDEKVLFPVKLTLPLTSSLFGKKDLIQSLFKRLRGLDLAHTVSYQQSSTFEYCQAVFHDALLLEQWQILLEPSLSLAKNSASDYTNKVFFDVLQPWAATQWLTLPSNEYMLQILPLD